MTDGNGMINICSFGAVGDGRTDNTAAIQKALDAAAETQATVYVPEGVYLTSRLRFGPHVGMMGNPTWSYESPGGPILRLNDEKASCLIDLTGAIGATLNGLCLEGADLGADVHGVLIDNPEYRTTDMPLLERCRISHFTGDGVRFRRIWAFRIRSCMMIENAGNGIWIRGWDGYLIDNCLTANGQAGYGAYEENVAFTLTGNRIEWNKAGGIVSHGGSHYNITGNYIDRSGGPGIWFRPRGEVACTIISAVGNVIYRSGKPEWCPDDEYASAQARFEGVHGLVFTGNSMNACKDDHGNGQFSPRYGIAYGALRNSVIKDNVMHCGAIKELMMDLGGHGDGVIVKDNVGSVFVPGQTPIADLNAAWADPAWERPDGREHR